MSVETVAEFRALAPDVLKRLEALLATRPGTRPIEAIRDQLAYALELVKSGTPLDEEQVKQLSIGALAARHVEDADLDLAQAIYDLEDFLETWRGERAGL